VADLLRFAAFHMGPPREQEHVLSPASVRLMQQPHTVAGSFADAYGFGWALRRFGDTTVVGHGGSTNGFRAQLSLVPARGLALAVLTNGSRGRHVAEAVEAHLLERHAGLRRTPPPAITLPAAALARVAGRYQRSGNDIRVSVEDQRLRIEMIAPNVFTGEPAPQPPIHAVPIAATTFHGLDGEAEGETIDFFFDEGVESPRFIRLHGRLAERVADASRE
jgi:hypothetical protein